MYLMYVDESGDTGRSPGCTPFFVLSGICIHESAWLPTLDAIIKFRRVLRQRYGIPVTAEIHASEWMRRGGSLSGKPRHVRLQVLWDVLQFQATLPTIQIINVIVDKAGKPKDFPVLERPWERLIVRFHNAISKGSIPGPKNQANTGLVVTDSATYEKPLRKLMRRLRRYNPVPSMYNQNQVFQVNVCTIEDAIHRDSRWSYFIQLADVNAYFLYQLCAPNGFVRQRGARKYVGNLYPVLNRRASHRNRWGIVVI